MKKYVFNGEEYTSFYDLRVALSNAQVPFGQSLQGADLEAMGVTVVEYEREKTPEQIQQELTVAVQKYLDARAQELNYDNCNSVCTYVNTGVAKFDAEGVAFRQWRSAVWATCYQILDACMAMTRPVPTPEELIAELPELVINYGE